MKTIFVLMLSVLIYMQALGYAADSTLVDSRSKIFAQSKEIKSLLPDSKDALLVSSMWDSCVIAMTQLDAYFSIVGIFNTIKKEDLNDNTINYLIDWLMVIKDTNAVNIKSLNSIAPSEAVTKVHIDKLRSYFIELNNIIDKELIKIGKLKEAVKTTKEKEKVTPPKQKKN
ncbi:MAG: hypothetical protein V1893_01080 [Candidatus Omnitrophota bacterium]